MLDFRSSRRCQSRRLWKFNKQKRLTHKGRISFQWHNLTGVQGENPCHVVRPAKRFRTISLVSPP